MLFLLFSFFFFFCLFVCFSDAVYDNAVITNEEFKEIQLSWVKELSYCTGIGKEADRNRERRNTATTKKKGGGNKVKNESPWNWWEGINEMVIITFVAVIIIIVILMVVIRWNKWLLYFSYWFYNAVLSPFSLSFSLTLQLLSPSRQTDGMTQISAVVATQQQAWNSHHHIQTTKTKWKNTSFFTFFF